MRMLVIGFLIGFGNIGAMTARQIQVQSGKPVLTLASSFILSFAYFLSVSFVVNRDLHGYLGFSLGAATVTFLMAERKRRQLKLEAEQGEQDEANEGY